MFRSQIYPSAIKVSRVREKERKSYMFRDVRRVFGGDLTVRSSSRVVFAGKYCDYAGIGIITRPFVNIACHFIQSAIDMYWYNNVSHLLKADDAHSNES